MILGLLVAVVGFLFRESFNPDMATFANDGPLGLVAAACNRFPAAWMGVWADLNWVGLNGGSTPFDLTSLLAWALGPLGFIKFYPAITLVVLGLSAWLFFRQLGFHPAVCLLGGVAAALNTDFFSYACWGLGTLTLCVASVFLALAALTSGARPAWARPVLAGVALGHALMEGFDNGAIFSLYVAAFALVHAWLQGRTVPAARRLGAGVLGTAVVAVVSGLVAAHVLISLVQLNVSGVVGMSQDKESRANRWLESTQWSLPPRETLRTVIPGLYGYRMDTPEGGQYWGLVGSHPQWDDYLSARSPNPQQAPRAILRYSGAGHYAGVLVVLLAAFALARSLRREGVGAFTPAERRWVWFWGAAALLSLLFAFGRYAPFYQVIYALPYFNTIRNPVKFLHPLSLCLVVLFAYGLQALWRGWVTTAAPRTGSPGFIEAVRATFRRSGAWEQRWALGTAVLTAAAILGWLIYGTSRSGLVQHLGLVGFEAAQAEPIARHSIQEVGIFAGLLALGVLIVLATLGGVFAGARARLATVALGGLLCLDLARANIPWIQHYNWRERYASNPLFELLRRAPHEGRLTGQMPFALPGQGGRLQESLGSVYGIEWLQHQFRYYDIQSLDIVQMPRIPADRAAYLQALRGQPLREWELGNVRWLLTLAPLADAMNEQLDTVQKRFRLRTAFNLSQTPTGVIQVETNSTGPFGLLEFTGALPRAMLFDRWRSAVTDEESLSLLASTNFNPHAEVLVAEQVPAPAVDTATQPAGTVAHQSYSPTRVVLATETRTPAVLLLNDKHDPSWHVYVDGKEDTLLRANFLMRGVYLGPGKHQVEFRFEPSLTTFWTSLSALAAGLALCGWVAWRNR